MTQKWEVERDGQLDLEFEGECIANVMGKRSEEQVAWEDLFLWQTTLGQYVVQRVRNDKAFGATHEAHHSYNPTEILKWLKGEDEYISKYAKELLKLAAKTNDEFAGIATVQLD